MTHEKQGGKEMSRIVVVNAGPRKGWNTDTLLTEAGKGAASKGAEVVRFDLFRLEKYTGCISCFGCKKDVSTLADTHALSPAAWLTWLLAATPEASLPTCTRGSLVIRASGKEGTGAGAARGRPRSFSYTTGRRLQRPSGRPCWRRPSLWGWWPGGV